MRDAALRGLRQLHSRGILHSDPDGSNMLVTPDGRVMWVDFQYSRMRAPRQALREEERELRRRLTHAPEARHLFCSALPCMLCP